jgi:hypothetical protein
MQRLLLICIFTACGPNAPYSPSGQEFDDLDDWGSGISGFNPAPAIPQDTGGGSGGSVDGIYTGTYSVSVNVTDTGMNCSCTSSSLTIAITGGEIQVGQGTQCAMDCGLTTTLRFRGSVDATGYAAGQLYEEDSFVYETTWTGAFIGGSGTGTFGALGMATSQGTSDISGTFTIAGQ